MAGANGSGTASHRRFLSRGIVNQTFLRQRSADESQQSLFKDRLEALSYFTSVLQNRSIRSSPFSRFAMLVA